MERYGEKHPVQTMEPKNRIGKLIYEIESGAIDEIKPVLAPGSEFGFTYARVENLLGMNTRDVTSVCELLVDENILDRQFCQTILACPNCRSANLQGTFSCLKCGSPSIIRGRILEHLPCGNIATEEDYRSNGHYFCPKCKTKFKFLGTDYRSIGVNYLCRNCQQISDQTTANWQCLKCALKFRQDEAYRSELYSYRTNPSNSREDLQRFELGIKAQFIQALGKLGYDVTERALTTGISKSGVQHALSLIACKYNGFIVYTVGFGVVFSSQVKGISMDKVFKFDEKAFDLGIRDKFMIVIPGLSEEARLFAQQQQIKVFDRVELENYVAAMSTLLPAKVKTEPPPFQDKTGFLRYLENLGYRVEPGGTVEGKSGARHTFDIVTYYDDGLISHTMGIAVMAAPEPIHLDAVVLFNAKAYDAGIHDKVLLLSPCLTKDGAQYALKQKIKAVEVENLSSYATI